MVAIRRVVHLPTDGKRDDRVARDATDLAERLALAVAKMLKDLERDEQVITARSSTGHGAFVASWTMTRPRKVASGRTQRSMTSDPTTISQQVRPELQRCPHPAPPDEVVRLAACGGQVGSAASVVRVLLREPASARSRAGPAGRACDRSGPARHRQWEPLPPPGGRSTAQRVWGARRAGGSGARAGAEWASRARAGAPRERPNPGAPIGEGA